MKKITFIAALLVSIQGFAQNGSNLTQFTPSALLGKGQYEIQSFNNLYSQNSVRNAEGDKIDLGQRQIFLSSMFMFTYGVSNNSKLNVGLDVNVNRARYTDGSAGALGIFGNNEGDFTRTVISTIGPRVKFSPLNAVPRLSVQSAFWIPVADDLESPRFVTHDRYTWWTQIFYDRSFGTNWQLFLQLDFLYRFKTQEIQENFFRTPVSAFLSYFPNANSTVFIMAQHSPAFGRVEVGDQSEYGRLRWFSQIGIGAKYQLTRQLGVELSYANFIASRNDGAGQTVNLGFRFIK